MTSVNQLTYSELSSISSFEERYEYLRIGAVVGDETFGTSRYMNQMFYRSKRWRHIRNSIIIRDEGCDLGHPDHLLYGTLLIHHLNPLRQEDFDEDSDRLWDPENLIATCHDTHNAIHYGDSELLLVLPPERKPNDTFEWTRKGEWWANQL